MTGLMRATGRGAFLAVLLGAVAFGAPPVQDAKKAKEYLKEVKKHLLESYIDCDKLKDEDLVKAGLQALAEAAMSREFSSLAKETREAVRNAVRGAGTVEEAIDAAAEAAGEADLDFILLADHAARAMVKATGDPFSRILTSDEFNKLLKMLQGGAREDSLGMAVQIRDGKGTVAFVQYGYPAYDEGIGMGDDVLKVNDRPVSEFTQDEMNETLKVKPGEKIEFVLRRSGIARDLVFRITQRKVKPRDVHYALLPEGIGYVRLTIFDNKLVSETRKALEEMKGQGMRACILDLRHNPGGALPACTGVADLFLGQGLTITKTVSHYKPSLGGMQLPGLGGDQMYRTRKASEFEDVPLVCLINGASASASEMLAGALQDHKRATLIGEKTYGKGVGQSPIFLNALFQKRYLYLTVMRYTTPNGNDVDHVGIPPAIAYPGKRHDAKTFTALWDLRESGALDRYLDRNWEEKEELFRKLAASDGFETSRYPGFDRLHSSLQTTLTKDQVREELRRAIRRRIVSETGTPYVLDLETDLQLQRAVVELLDRPRD